MSDHNIINFDDLADIMKTMGKAVGDVTSDLNKGLNGLGDILIKMGHDLDKSEIEELDRLLLSLTEKDREELLNLDSSDLKEWWGNKCDNEKLVDILVSSTDTFSQFINIKNSLSNVFEKTSDCNPMESIGSMFSNILNSLDNVVDSDSDVKISKDREMLIDTASNIINVLSSDEIKRLKSKCDNLQENWSNRIDHIESLITALPQISDINKIKEKINDICIDIELLRHTVKKVNSSLFK